MEIKLEEINIDHEFEQLLPPLAKEEYKNLENSILKYGMRDSIKLWEDQDSKIYIVDGHNRYNICKKNSINIEPYQLSFLDPTLFLSKSDVMRWMLDTQLGRRNLTPMQRFAIAQKYKSLYEEKAKQNLSDGGKGLTNLSKVNTRKEMAKTVGVSEGTYAKMDKIYHSGNEELKTKVKANEISIDKAYQEIKPNVSKTEKHLIPEHFSNTSECDFAIEEIEQQEKRLQEEKEKLYLIRQKLYDKTPNDDLRCEVVKEEKEEFIFESFAWYHFYLIKKDNKKFVIKLPYLDLINVDKVNTKIKKLDIIIDCKLTKDEKRLLESAIVKTHKKCVENEITNKELEDAIEKEWQRRASNRAKLSGNYIDKIRDYSIVKDIINAGYRTLAKKYHPDTLNGDGEKMQLINDAKNTLDTLIQLAEHQEAS